MINLVSVLIVSSLALAPVKEAESQFTTKIEDLPCRYETVSEWRCESNKNSDTYAINNDKSIENNNVRTLEETGRKERWVEKEKRPFAKIVVRVDNGRGEEQFARKVSGEEILSDEDMFESLNFKFDKMYEIKEKIDEHERECAKLWSEYYALKDVYDRALAKYSEKWAEDNGINFVPKKAWRR